MPYSISEIIVSNTTEKVIALNWAYENPDGKISNQWRLMEPYGDTPLASCTEEVLVGWLTAQLPNDSSDFDQQIANAKEQQEFAKTLAPYQPHPAGPPTPIAAEIEQPGGTQEPEQVEEPEKPVAKSSKAKAKK